MRFRPWEPPANDDCGEQASRLARAERLAKYFGSGVVPDELGSGESLEIAGLFVMLRRRG